MIFLETTILSKENNLRNLNRYGFPILYSFPISHARPIVKEGFGKNGYTTEDPLVLG